MRLHFNAALVQQLLQHSSGAATSRKAPGGACSSAQGAGLWLVNDHGIYLMSGGVPESVAGDGSDLVPAFAEEASPAENPETFHTKKHKVLDGGESSTFLPEAWVTGLLTRSSEGRVCIDLTRKGARVASPTQRRQRAGKAVHATAPARRKTRQSGDAVTFIQDLLAILDAASPEDREARRRRRAVIRMTLYTMLLAAEPVGVDTEADVRELSDALGYTIAAP